MNRTEFAKGMLLLQAGIGREFGKPTLEVWFHTLGDLTEEDFLYAIERFMAESTTPWPMPAQLRAFADDRQNGVEMDHCEAFAAVMKAVRVYGSYQVLKGMASLDAITQNAVRGCGGFLWFCQLEVDQRHTAAAQFRMAYQSARDRDLRHRRLPETLRPPKALKQPQPPTNAEESTSKVVPKVESKDPPVLNEIPTKNIPTTLEVPE